ncbi:MAG TPA: sulfatase [Thermoanaerobaculia bacterium]|jgi:arylsulfatase A-like enzyme|nr:sulfatase [Thermoanaerobaculia bacterium]
MNRLLRALLPLALLALGGCPLGVVACHRPAAAPGPRHVFLITVDTLRADHTSLYGYPRQTTPRLDALASSGVLFADTVAQWPKTGASFASMFTGRYPQSTGMMQRAALRIPAEYRTLPETMQRAGYTTGAVISNAVLGANLGWNRGFDEYLQTWGDGEFPQDPQVFRGLVHAPRVNQLALPLLDRHAKDERLFVWVHYTDPHAPYLLPPGVPNPFLDDGKFPGAERVPPKVARAYRLGQQLARRYYVAQYDANVKLADRCIGELLDHARRLGLLDDALVIFAADHGESLGEHGSWFEHGPLPYNTTARVPLLIFGRGVVRGSRVERPVELVDLYPTLRELAAAGVTVRGLEGHSLAPWLRGTPPHAAAEGEFRYSYSEAGERPRYFRSVQDGAWKLVQGFDRRGSAGVPGGWELYDLAADPGETANLATARSEELRRLRAVLLHWARPGAERRGHAGAADEDAEKALHALGYAN